MFTIIIVIIDYDNLRELFYDRNPGDARVKVGSERKFVSRRCRPNCGVTGIGVT